MVGDILSSGLGSIWYDMMWFCRYLNDFGYSITIMALASVWSSNIILN